jgi:hypothetical protein
MVELDPSPWLILAVPFFLAVAYVFRRGLVRNEFRVRGKKGWAHYFTWSLGWTLATAVNLVFLGASMFVVYLALTRGSDFSREPELSMPPRGGRLTETIQVRREPSVLAECIADLNHGRVYDLGSGKRRVAVRNGRNAVLYTFEIEPDRGGSRMEVRRWSVSPFVGWARCLAPEDQ